MTDKKYTWETPLPCNPTEEQLYTFEEHQRIINAAIDKQVAEIAPKLMVNNPFGFPPQPKLGYWQRIKRICSVHCTRAHNAWLVLCGYADIDNN